jgi:hypothetical protein
MIEGGAERKRGGRREREERGVVVRCFPTLLGEER